MDIPAAELIQRAGRTQQAELVLPAIVPPVGLEVDIRTIYMRVVREWGREASERIMPAYAATVGEGIRDTVDDVEAAVEESGAALNRLVLMLGPELEDWVVRVEQWHRGRFAQLLTPVGVRLDTLLGRGDTARTLQATLAENLALIRSLNDQMRNGVSGAVFRGLQNRSTAVEVGREIRKLAGVGRNRAELIAADQLQKLTSRLDQERQQQLGSKEFQWAHSGKKHPRPHHKARDGLRFKWASAVGRTDPPGRAIRCGCKARAVIKLAGVEEAPATAAAAAPPPTRPAPAPAAPTFNYLKPPATFEGAPIVRKTMPGSQLAVGGSGGIAINSGRRAAAAFRDIDTFMTAQHAAGWLSSPHPNHVIWHEFAHWRVKNEFGHRDSLLTNTRASQNPRFKAIAEKVSKYAATNGHEFISEVYAAQRAGVELDDDVLKLFVELLGGKSL